MKHPLRRGIISDGQSAPVRKDGETHDSIGSVECGDGRPVEPVLTIVVVVTDLLVAK